MIRNLLLFLLVSPLMAQTPAPATPPKDDSPQLTALEKLGLNTVVQEFNQASQLQSKANTDYSDFQKEVSEAHPGYTFNPATGGLVKAVVPPKTDSKPVPPQKDTPAKK